MSTIAAQCPDCCTCPTWTVEGMSRTKSKSKCGFQYFWAGQSKFYLKSKILAGGSFTKEFFAFTGCTGNLCDFGPRSSPIKESWSASGEITIDPDTCADEDTTSATLTRFYCTDPNDTTVYYKNGLSAFVAVMGWPGIYRIDTYTENSWTVTGVDCVSTLAISYSGSFTEEYSIEYTTDQLKSLTIASLPAYGSSWGNSNPSSILNLTAEGHSCAVYQSRYRFRFPIPAVGSGKCYRLAWVERFIPEAGVGVTSVEVISRGVYRPGLSTSAAASGKTAATAVAVMSSAGAVAGISVLVPGDYRPVATITGGGGTGGALDVLSLDPATGGVDQVRITPGSGYTSAPTLSFTNVTSPRVRATATLTVDSDPASPTYRQITGITWTNRGDYRPALTFASAINGGTTATATSSINSLGQLIGATITGGGNYLPTLAFSAGGGTGATATVAMDAQGGIETVAMTASGSAYAAAPSLTITPRITGPIAAVLHLHLGTETARCAAWDGVTPAGYVAATASTWPTLPSGSPGYFEIPVPTSEGTTTIANVRAFCDCSACP